MNRFSPSALRLVALLAVLLGIVALATVLGTLGGPRLDRATGTALIMLTVVLGLKIFVGDSGIFSFGHIALMGLGAYTTAIATMSPAQKKFQLPDLPGPLATLHLGGVQAALLSGLVAVVAAGIISIPLMRLSGLTASLATVALLIASNSVFKNLETFTRGSAGLIIDADPPSIAGLLAWAGIALVIAGVFRQSRIGVRLAASREDEVAARAIGIRVWWERGLAFAVSAFLVGVAGSLFARYFGSLNPDSFFLDLTFTAIAMLVVGGLTTVSGAVLGTLVISTALELLRAVEDGITVGGFDIPSRSGLADAGLALGLLAVLLARPAGITGGREIPVARLLTSLFRAVSGRIRRPPATGDPQVQSEPATSAS